MTLRRHRTPPNDRVCVRVDTEVVNVADTAAGQPLLLHRRQFVIGPEPFLARDDWKCRQLDDSTWVSHCPELRIGWTADAEGVQWVLLGLAVETREECDHPLAMITRTATAAISEVYEGWAGRWVLVGRGEVHLDATGQLASYYGTATDGRMWVSSSPALLAAILAPAGQSLAFDSRLLRYEVGLPWYPPPRSPFHGMRRQLPSQIVRPAQGSIEPRRLFPPIVPLRASEATLELLGRSLITTLRRVSDLGRPLWLGLSAGADSRVVLAAAHLAAIDMMIFTRIAARTALGDRLLPPQLAAKLGHPHVTLKGGGYQAGRRGLVAAHTAGSMSEGDAEPLLQGVRDSLDGINLTGQCFVVGKLAGRKLFPDVIADADTTARHIGYAFHEPATSSAVDGLREWLKWVARTPHEHLDWRDRFWIEQRLAGWQGAKEQVYDLVRLERFAVVNAARNYALILGLSEEKRKNGLYQVELIRSMAPSLLEYPINPPDSYFGTVRAVATRLRHPRDTLRRFLARMRRARRTGPPPSSG